MLRSFFCAILFGLMLSGGAITTFAQEPLSEFQREQLRLQQLQTELLTARLSLLETRYAQLAEKLSDQAGNAEVLALNEQVKSLRDSLSFLHLSMLKLERELALKSIAPQPEKIAPLFLPGKVVGLNPARLLEGTFEISGEWRFARNWSGEAAILGTYVTKGGVGGSYLKGQEFQLYDAALGTWKDYDGEMFTGYGFQIRAKNFLLGRVDQVAAAPLGLYAGPVAMFRHVKIQGYQYVWDGQNSKRTEVTRHLDIGSLGLNLGYQFPVHQVLALDLYIGGMMRISKYSNEEQFTRYKKWSNIDYSGVLPTAGIRVGVLR
jgi:hypothetical protein